jgi:hypothetical protein
MVLSNGMPIPFGRISLVSVYLASLVALVVYIEAWSLSTLTIVDDRQRCR